MAEMFKLSIIYVY